MVALAEHGLDVRVMGDVVGHASALKMCYAALTKGLQALGARLARVLELLVPRQRVDEAGDLGNVLALRAPDLDVG